MHSSDLVMQRVKEMKLAQVSLAIVFGKISVFAHISDHILTVFILCHSVKWIPNIWELQQSGLDEDDLDWPVWIEYVTYTSRLLTTINCSTNVFIYFIKHRAELMASCICPVFGHRERTQSELVNF